MITELIVNFLRELALILLLEVVKILEKKTSYCIKVNPC